MSRTATKLLLLVALLACLAFSAYAARGNIDWCGPEQCRSSGREEEEVQETLSVTIDNEEEQVLAVYEDEESSTLDANKEKDLIPAPSGKSYECKSDCRVLFASSSCERCTYPFAFYNKNAFKNNICYDSISDLKSLTKVEKDQAKQMCITDGLCSCQPWERLEAYMAHSCTFNCAWIKNVRYGVPKNIIYLPKVGACPNKKTYAKSSKNYIKYCQSGTYTKNWLMSYYGVTRVFNWNAALTNAVIDANKKPNKVILKPIGNFASAGASATLFFDTDNKLLAENGWRASLYLHKNTFELNFDKTYKLNKVAGKTRRDYINEGLNLANKEGFNSGNADAKDFDSRVKVSKDSVSVSFTIKVAAKQTKEFKAACSAVSKIFSESLSPKVNTLPPNVAAPVDIVSFINAHVPALLTKNQAIAEYLKTKPLRLVNYIGQQKYSENNFKGQRVYLNVDYTKNGLKSSIDFSAYSQEVLDEVSAALLQKLKPEWVLSTSQD